MKRLGRTKYINRYTINYRDVSYSEFWEAAGSSKAKDGVYCEYYNNGQLYDKIYRVGGYVDYGYSMKYKGGDVHRSYYSNGKTRSKYLVQKNGIAISYHYYQNGRIKETCTFGMTSLCHGHRKRYDRHRKLIKVELYRNGQLCSTDNKLSRAILFNPEERKILFGE